MIMRYWQISKNRSVPPSLKIKVKTKKVKHLCGGWCCLLVSFKPCTLYPIKQFPGWWSFYMFYLSTVAGTHYSWIVLLTCFHAHFTYVTSIFRVKPIALPFTNTLFVQHATLFTPMNNVYRKREPPHYQSHAPTWYNQNAVENHCFVKWLVYLAATGCTLTGYTVITLL